MNCLMLVAQAGSDLEMAGQKHGNAASCAMNRPYSLATLQPRLEIMLRMVRHNILPQKLVACQTILHFPSNPSSERRQRGVPALQLGSNLRDRTEWHAESLTP